MAERPTFGLALDPWSSALCGFSDQKGGHEWWLGCGYYPAKKVRGSSPNVVKVVNL